MNLQFYGAVRAVTGSQHMLGVNGHQVLLECGLYQGRRKVAEKRNRHLPFDAGKVDACTLSHAHLDHSGNLPNLVKQGFGGPILCTPATADLCSVMLRDSAHIQEKDAEWISRRHRKRDPDAPAAEPLYTMEDAEQCLEQLQSLDRRADLLSQLTTYFDEPERLLGELDLYLDIEAEEIQAVAIEALGPDRRVALRVVPNGDRG